MLRQRRRPGQAVSEYLVFMALILGAFVLMQPYILRGFSGRWKSVGDSLGFGRLYDPNKTTECLYDYEFFNIWYSAQAFSLNNCDRPCYSSLLNRQKRREDCGACIWDSRNEYCE